MTDSFVGWPAERLGRTGALYLQRTHTRARLVCRSKRPRPVHPAKRCASLREKNGSGGLSSHNAAFALSSGRPKSLRFACALHTSPKIQKQSARARPSVDARLSGRKRRHRRRRGMTTESMCRRSCLVLGIANRPLCEEAERDRECARPRLCTRAIAFAISAQGVNIF